MLPKLDRPTYNITLPLSGKSGKIHPFTIKEQKILSLAEKEKDPDTILNAIIDTIDKCSDFDTENMNTVDMQYTFLQIRKVSVGSKIDITMTCPHCEHEVNTSIIIDDYKIKKENDLKDIIMISDTYGIKLNLPTIKKLKFIEELDDEIQNIVLYIDSVFDNDSVTPIIDNSKEDIEEFVTSLPITIISDILEFATKLPSYEFHKDWKCVNCEENNSLDLVGIGDFFT